MKRNHSGTVKLSTLVNALGTPRVFHYPSQWQEALDYTGVAPSLSAQPVERIDSRRILTISRPGGYGSVRYTIQDCGTPGLTMTSAKTLQILVFPKPIPDWVVHVMDVHSRNNWKQGEAE